MQTYKDILGKEWEYEVKKETITTTKKVYNADKDTFEEVEEKSTSEYVVSKIGGEQIKGGSIESIISSLGGYGEKIAEKEKEIAQEEAKKEEEKRSKEKKEKEELQKKLLKGQDDALRIQQAISRENQVGIDGELEEYDHEDFVKRTKEALGEDYDESITMTSDEIIASLSDEEVEILEKTMDKYGSFDDELIERVKKKNRKPKK